MADKTRYHNEDSAADNRHSLIMLIAAGVKLEVAARLAKEAVHNVESSGLLPFEEVQKMVVDINAYLQRINSAIGLIPRT